MAGERYVHITPEEFERLMQENFFVCINADQSQRELIYAFMWHDGTYALKVYSSIVPAQNGSRDVGKDAIRVVLFVLIENEYMPKWKASRVYRTKGWRENLQQRIDEGLERGCEGRDYKCGNCGAPMILREGRRGFFYGCVNYGATDCRYTEDYDEE
jgi:ssDNA-binding Zn-finger/Zn-ribbon topoisomerase 1